MFSSFNCLDSSGFVYFARLVFPGKCQQRDQIPGKAIRFLGDLLITFLPDVHVFMCVLYMCMLLHSNFPCKLCVQCYSMLKTLERYQKCSYGAPEPNTMSAQEALVICVDFLIDFFS